MPSTKATSWASPTGSDPDMGAFVRHQRLPVFDGERGSGASLREKEARPGDHLAPSPMVAATRLSRRSGPSKHRSNRRRWSPRCPLPKRLHSRASYRETRRLDTEEALSGSSRLEPLHLALSSP